MLFKFLETRSNGGPLSICGYYHCTCGRAKRGRNQPLMLDICDFKSTHNRKEVGVSFLEFSFLGGGVVFIALL